MKFLVEITENGFTKVCPVPARMGMGEASSILGISKTDLVYLCATGELEVNRGARAQSGTIPECR